MNNDRGLLTGEMTSSPQTAAPVASARRDRATTTLSAIAGGESGRTFGTDFEERPVPTFPWGEYSLTFYPPNIDPRGATYPVPTG